MAKTPQTDVRTLTHTTPAPGTLRGAQRMARRDTPKAKRSAAPPPAEEPAQPVLKRTTERLLDAIRPRFRTYIGEYVRFNQRAADIAPDFMRAFYAWAQDTGGSFVAFVRMLDPDVPADSEGYKAHPTYNAADYLRRLVGKPEGEGETTEDADKPAGMSDAFVRLLAAIVALIPGNQVERLWTVIGTELHWSERRVQTLRQQVEEAEPLITTHVERSNLVVEER